MDVPTQYVNSAVYDRLRGLVPCRNVDRCHDWATQKWADEPETHCCMECPVQSVRVRIVPRVHGRRMMTMNPWPDFKWTSFPALTFMVMVVGGVALGILINGSSSASGDPGAVGSGVCSSY
jgi:hypothetical protein